MRTQLLITAALVLLANTAHAQADAGKVLVDQWAERYAANNKISYASMRILELPDGFVREERDWTPMAEGALSSVSRTETDATGRVRAKTKTETTPFGKTVTSITTQNGALSWSRAIRAQPKQTGTIKVPVYDKVIVSYLIAVGRADGAKRSITLLDLPKTEEKTISATKAGDRTTVVAGDETYELDAKGSLIRGGRTDMIATMLPATEAQAKDMTRPLTPPVKVAGLNGDAFTVDGVTLKRPGQGWAIAVPAPGSKNSDRVMVMHPHRSFLMVMTIPVGVPDDEAPRLKLGQGLMAQMNNDPEGLQFSNPESATAWGATGLSYTVGGKMDGETVSGSGWLLKRTPQKALLVMLICPADIKDKLAVHMEQAQSALSLKAPTATVQPAGVKQGAFPCGATFPLPGWKRTTTKRQRVCWNSPGGSQIQAWEQPSATDEETAANQWAQATAPQFKAKAPPASEIKVGARAGWGTSFPVTAPNGVALTLKLIVVPSGEAGKIVLVMLVAGPDLDEATMAKILAGVTWK